MSSFMPNLSVKKNSDWDEAEIREFLSMAVIPMRLAVNDSGGFPRLCSLWFGFDGEAIVGVSHKNAYISRLLLKDGRCAFEIASNTEPYQGVRGQAVATIVPYEGKLVLPELIDKYIGSRHPGLEEWLMSRVDDEYVIRLDIDWISAWDYTDRMII